MVSDLSTPSLHKDELGLWRCNSQSECLIPENGLASYLEVEDRSFWCRHRNQCITAAMHRFPPAGPLLYLGGGTGFVARGIQDAGFEAAVLEAVPVPPHIATR